MVTFTEQILNRKRQFLCSVSTCVFINFLQQFCCHFFTCLLPSLFDQIVFFLLTTPRKKLAAGSNSSGTKWSVMFTKISSWQKQLKTQATTLRILNQGTIPGNTRHKNLRSAKVGSPKNYKQASLNNKGISHPTHYHPFQLKYLSQVSTLARPFSTHHPTQLQLSPSHISSASLLLV